MRRMLSENYLRRIIREEKARTVRKSPSLSSLLFEQDDSGKDEKSGKFKSIGGKTNVKDVDADDLFNQLVSKDASAPIFAAVKGETGQTLDPEKTAKFYEGMGKETFVKRWQTLAGKIPASGLPKSQMPFLPGPSDAKGSVDDLKDVLTPGGKYNVDVESVNRNAPALSEAVVYSRWGKLAGIIAEKMKPPGPNELTPGPDADKYLKSGLEDGDDKDDNVPFDAPGSIKASEAIPTQSNINVGKTICFATPKDAGGWEIKPGPIGAYGSTNNEILDGHHRWSGLMISNPDGDMGTYMNIDLAKVGGGDKTAGLQQLTAIGNALGNPTKT